MDQNTNPVHVILLLDPIYAVHTNYCSIHARDDRTTLENDYNPCRHAVLLVRSKSLGFLGVWEIGKFGGLEIESELNHFG